MYYEARYEKTPEDPAASFTEYEKRRHADALEAWKLVYDSHKSQAWLASAFLLATTAMIGAAKEVTDETQPALFSAWASYSLAIAIAIGSTLHPIDILFGGCERKKLSERSTHWVMQILYIIFFFAGLIFSCQVLESIKSTGSDANRSKSGTTTEVGTSDVKSNDPPAPTTGK